MDNKLIQLSLFCIPLVISIISAKACFYYLVPVIIILIFVLVSVLPICCRHENMFIFVVSTIILQPVNLSVIKNILAICGDEYEIIGLIYSLMLLFCISCAENIVLGICARLIWKEQNEL